MPLSLRRRITQKRKKMPTAITLTAEYKKRIVSAISETERLLAKEEKYSFWNYK